MTDNWRSRIVKRGTIRAGDIVPHPHNPRKHPAAQAKALSAAVGDLGQLKPVVININNGYLVDGELRSKAALRAGEEVELEAVWVDLTEEEHNRALAVLDYITGMATYDSANMNALLTDVGDATDEMLRVLDSVGEAYDAFAPAPVEREADAPADSAAELQEEWGVQLGDRFVLTNASGTRHVLVCGDATDSDVVQHLLQGAAPELMVTDPPYGVNYDPKWRRHFRGQRSYREGSVQNDDRADWREAYAHFPGSVAYVWHSGLYTHVVMDGLESVGLLPTYQIIWNKAAQVFGRGHYHWKHEPCAVAVRKGQSHLWAGSRTQNTVWDIFNDNARSHMTGTHAHNETIDDLRTYHGTQKPLECMQRPIRNHEVTGVYDPFLGSGTTMAAAELLNQERLQQVSVYGIDNEPKWCATILDRLQRLGCTIEKE